MWFFYCNNFVRLQLKLYNINRCIYFKQSRFFLTATARHQFSRYNNMQTFTQNARRGLFFLTTSQFGPYFQELILWFWTAMSTVFTRTLLISLLKLFSTKKEKHLERVFSWNSNNVLPVLNALLSPLTSFGMEFRLGLPHACVLALSSPNSAWPSPSGALTFPAHLCPYFERRETF